MSQNRSLHIDIIRDRHAKPLAIVKNFPGLDAEMYSDNLRKMAAQLIQAADDLDALNSEQSQAISLDELVIRQEGERGIKPLPLDLSHRWAPLLGGINLWGVTETIDYTALRVCSILSLLKCQFADSAGARLDNESAYYSFATVSMDIKDIAAFIDAFKPMLKIDQHKSAPAGHRAFANIERSITKALGVIYLLCNQFTEDDSLPDSDRICGAIDSIVQDIADIRLSVKNFHKTIRTHQA